MKKQELVEKLRDIVIELVVKRLRRADNKKQIDFKYTNV